MLIITTIILCCVFRDNFNKMRIYIHENAARLLSRFAVLIPYIFGAFVLTSFIQISVYEIAYKKYSEQGKQNNSLILSEPLPLWKQPTLLNLTNFHWIMNNESLCQLDPSQKDARVVLALVHTARNNFRERMSIRKSWGSMPMYKNWTLRLAFLLGEPDPTKNSTEDLLKLKKTRKKLYNEHVEFGDIIIGSFVDSYHNLTYKHMMGYKFALTYCPDAQFVMKVDDDMFTDILRWLDWRTNDMKRAASNSTYKSPELYGFNYGNTSPMRSGKWYVSEEEYPEKKYPDYSSGWGYGITVSLLKKLYNATTKAKFLWVDDAYATGVLLREVKKEEPGIKVKYLGSKISGDVKHYKKMCQEKAWHRKRLFKSVTYVARGRNMENEMMCMWNKTLYDSKYKFEKPFEIV